LVRRSHMCLAASKSYIKETAWYTFSLGGPRRVSVLATKRAVHDTRPSSISSRPARQARGRPHFRPVSHRAQSRRCLVSCATGTGCWHPSRGQQWFTVHGWVRCPDACRHGRQSDGPGHRLSSSGVSTVPPRAGRPRDPRRPATGVRGRESRTHCSWRERAWWSGLVVACLTGGSAARHDRCPSSPCRVTPFVAPVPSLAGCELRRASLGKPRKLGGSPTGRRILDAKSGRKRPFAPFRDIFLSARFVCI
jgi:hypothetical protein